MAQRIITRPRTSVAAQLMRGDRKPEPAEGLRIVQHLRPYVYGAFVHTGGEDKKGAEGRRTLQKNAFPAMPERHLWSVGQEIMINAGNWNNLKTPISVEYSASDNFGSDPFTVLSVFNTRGGLNLNGAYSNRGLIAKFRGLNDNETTWNQREWQFQLDYQTDADGTAYASFGVFDNGGSYSNVGEVKGSTVVVHNALNCAAGVFRPGTEVAVFLNGIKDGSKTSIPSQCYSGSANIEIGCTYSNREIYNVYGQIYLSVILRGIALRDTELEHYTRYPWSLFELAERALIVPSAAPQPTVDQHPLFFGTNF